MAQGAEHGFDVTVGAGAFDEKGFAGGDKGFASEGAADEVDEGIGQVGEVAEGFVLDLLTDANRAAEQVGGINLIFVAAISCGYMNSARSR